MLPGFSGHLVSEAYLEVEGRADAAAVDRSLEQIRRDLLKRWTRSADLGPASAPRALLQSRAEPLVLVVAPWGERLDPLWRLAVTQAMRRLSAWCVLFNGVNLRIVDAGRLYARRYLDFDLELAIDD